MAAAWRSAGLSNIVSSGASFGGSCNVRRSTTDRTVLSSASSCARRPHVVSQRPSATTAEQNDQAEELDVRCAHGVGALPVRTPSRVWTRSFVAEMTTHQKPCTFTVSVPSSSSIRSQLPLANLQVLRRVSETRRSDRKRRRSPCSRHAPSPARAGADRRKASSR